MDRSSPPTTRRRPASTWASPTPATGSPSSTARPTSCASSRSPRAAPWSPWNCRGETPMKMRTLIVDDERLARQKLRTLLQRHSDVELVGECATGDAALADIARLQPDIVFLDVRMPGKSGFDVVHGLAPGPGPHVVFVTAYGDHAVEAFEVEAVDYLLKPFDRERLDRAVARVRTRSGEPGKALAKLGDLVMRLEGALAERRVQTASGTA